MAETTRALDVFISVRGFTVDFSPIYIREMRRCPPSYVSIDDIADQRVFHRCAIPTLIPFAGSST